MTTTNKTARFSLSPFDVRPEDPFQLVGVILDQESAPLRTYQIGEDEFEERRDWHEVTWPSDEEVAGEVSKVLGRPVRVHRRDIDACGFVAVYSVA